MGRTDAVLLSELNRKMGLTNEKKAFSVELVEQMAAGAKDKGDAERGSQLFQSLACHSCHRVGGSGGDIGPDLTAIGTTLEPSRIVEELIWPNRQIKEGYSVLQIGTVDGRTHLGYQRRTRESEEKGDVVIQELNSSKLITFSKSDIEQMKKTGSTMPIGLTAILDDQQLYDLIMYLTQLGELK